MSSKHRSTDRQGPPQYDQPSFGRPFRAPVPAGWNFVVERWVTLPAHAVTAVLRDRCLVAPPDGFALAGDGTLFVDETPQRSEFGNAPGYELWRAAARLLSGRSRHVAFLDIEVGIRTPASVLVQLRPLDRNPQRWSTRRTRRYFVLAHAAADRLAQLLDEHASLDALVQPRLRDLMPSRPGTSLPTAPVDLERAFARPSVAAPGS